MTKILKKHWIEIMAADSYKSVEEYLSTAFNDMKNISPNVYKSRLERLKTINANFIMTLDELHDIADIPFVKNAIVQTVETHKQRLLSDVSAEYKQQLDKLKEEHDIMLETEKDRYEDAVKREREHYDSILQSITDDEAKITATLNEKQLEIEILDETIASKNDEITKIDELVDQANKRKDSIISDFSIIKLILE